MGRTQRLAQPQEFGKYQLVARLAHGRLGDVYKAKSHGVEGFEKILVVKVINPGLSAVPGFIDAVIEEAKRAVSLSHANVAQVYDIGQDEGQNSYYLAMEHINGFDLARVLNLSRLTGRSWPQELSVFVASEVAKALDYAHRRKDFNFNSLNILHRALTPQNILLSFDGEVKLTDFGISRALELVDPIDDDDLRRRYLYAAPEVARGEAPTRQSDLFSLGLVLYEMLSGVHPYADDSAEVVQQRAQAGVIPPLTNHVEVPRPLLQLVESLLVPDPAGRASSAGTIYEELIGYLFGNNLQGDGRLLGMTLQELRRDEKRLSPDEATQEVGLEEISMADIQQALHRSEEDDTGLRELSESTKSALPSAKMQKLFQSPGGDDQQQPLPGALELYYQAAKGGRGKAVLLSGQLGSGRDNIADRLVDALGWRGNTQAFAIQTTPDDRYRPFGVLSDLILRCLHQTVAETLDHRESALQVLHQLRVSEEAIATLSALWGMRPGLRLGYEERRRHLTELFLALVRDFSRSGTLVLVIDRVERLDGLSLDVLRDIVAVVGKMPVMLVMGTETDEAMRAAFDIGKPEDLEAVRVSGGEPLDFSQFASFSDDAIAILTMLALSQQAMSQADLGQLTSIPGAQLIAILRQLTDAGAVRVPRPGMFVTGQPDVIVWVEKNLHHAEIERCASQMARYYTHRVVRGDIDRLTPTLIRLYAYAGDRRAMLSLAEKYARWLEREGWLKTTLEFYRHCADLLALKATGTPHVRINYLLSRAELALELSDLDECRASLQPVSALSEAVRNERGMIRGQLLMGQMAMQQDDLEDAYAHFKRATDAARGVHDPDLLARGMLYLAGWHERYGDMLSAQKTLEGAMNLYTRWGTARMDLGSRSIMLHRAARMWAARGMLPRAERLVQDLRQLADASSLSVVECRADWAEATVRAHRGEHTEALQLLQQAEQTARRYGLTALHIELIREQAAVFVASQDHEMAITITDGLIKYAAAHEDLYSEQRARDLRATACCFLGRDVERSLTHLHTSLRRAQSRRVPKDIYRCHTNLARALQALGRSDEARLHEDQARQVAASMRYQPAA